MRNCILATVRDVITDHVARGCCNGRQTFNRPKSALVLRVQPYLKELEQSSKAFPPKNTEKRPMCYVGISGLAKTVTVGYMSAWDLSTSVIIWVPEGAHIIT